jgi:hypothetical protein
MGPNHPVPGEGAKVRKRSIFLVVAQSGEGPLRKLCISQLQSSCRPCENAVYGGRLASIGLEILSEFFEPGIFGL